MSPSSLNLAYSREGHVLRRQLELSARRSFPVGKVLLVVVFRSSGSFPRPSVEIFRWRIFSGVGISIRNIVGSATKFRSQHTTCTSDPQGVLHSQYYRDCRHKKPWPLHSQCGVSRSKLNPVLPQLSQCIAAGAFIT